jgi:hypothetical protein
LFPGQPKPGWHAPQSTGLGFSSIFTTL